MGHTITEKILLSHLKGLKEIKPGDFICPEVDVCLGNDITSPIAIDRFEELGLDKVFNSNRVILVPDHFVPAKDMKSANQAKKLERFAEKYDIYNYFKLGKMGVEHAILPEQGLVLPGDLIIGADSHTCTHGALGAFATGVGSTDLAYAMAYGECWFKVPFSIKLVFKGKLKKHVGGKDLILHAISDLGVSGALYKSIEITGQVIRELDMEARLTMCNMAIEAGAKNGIVAPDRTTKTYVNRAIRNFNPARTSYKFYESDKDAKYERVLEYDVSDLDPVVAEPDLPSNGRSVKELTGIKVDQVVIGSCTNGRISDFEEAAEILQNRKIHPSVRLIAIPATQQVYLHCVKNGIAEIITRSGGNFCTPSCGPCLGGHMGILNKDEVAIATTNRNFVGRMGHPKSSVYLSNPAVAAASAINGRITDPQEIK